MADFDNIKSDYEDAYTQASGSWGSYLTEARTDLLMRLGDQWPEALKKWLVDNHREAYVFNKINRIVSIVTGYERKNRLSLKIGGVGMEDDPAASQMTGVILHSMSNNNGYEVMSDAFEWGSLVTGANLVNIYTDRENNIRYRRWPHNRFMLDPNFTAPDLSDCGYLLGAAPVTNDQAKMLCPDGASEIDKIAEGDATYTRWGNLTAAQGIKGKKMRLYEEFWERTTRKSKIIIDKTTGQQKIWEGKDAQLRFLMQNYPMLSAFDKWIDSVKLHVLLDGEPIWSGTDPNEIDMYPFVPVLGLWCPECDNYSLKLQPLIRTIRDPQRADNKRICQAIDIIESQIQSGWKAKENAVVNKQDLYAAGQGKTIWIKDGAQMADVEKLTPGDIPSGIIALHQLLDENITSIPGVNEELFGTETKDIPGVLSKMRQGAALTALQKLFDNYRFSLKLLGKLHVKMIQKNYDPQKVFRILNAQPVPDFYKEDLADYDCVPTQGLLTDTQKEMYYAELRALKQEGYPIPAAEVLKASSAQMKDQLIKAVQAGEQQQQQIEQVMAQEKEILNQLRKAKIDMDINTAKERGTQAQENVSTMKLNQAKTLVEMAKLKHDALMDTVDRALKIDVAQKGVKE